MQDYLKKHIKDLCKDKKVLNLFQNFFFEIIKMIKKIVINILIFRDKKLNLVFYSFLKPLINKGKTDKNLKKTKKLEKREKIQKKC